MSFRNVSPLPSVGFLYVGRDRFEYDGFDGAGIFKSTDRGVTWTHLLAKAGDGNFRYINRMEVVPSNSEVLVAATNRGIFRTTDGRATWIQVYSGVVQNLRSQPGNFNRMIGGHARTGMIYSDDAGVTWELASAHYTIPQFSAAY